MAGFDTDAAVAATQMTAPRLQVWLSRQVAKVEPELVEPRYRRAFTHRRVDTTQDLDGMGQLWTSTTAIDLAAIDTRLAENLGAEGPPDV